MVLLLSLHTADYMAIDLNVFTQHSRLWDTFDFKMDCWLMTPEESWNTYYSRRWCEWVIIYKDFFQSIRVTKMQRDLGNSVCWYINFPQSQLADFYTKCRYEIKCSFFSVSRLFTFILWIQIKSTATCFSIEFRTTWHLFWHPIFYCILCRKIL